MFPEIELFDVFCGTKKLDPGRRIVDVNPDLEFPLIGRVRRLMAFPDGQPQTSGFREERA
jgi:hypothetical protein